MRVLLAVLCVAGVGCKSEKVEPAKPVAAIVLPKKPTPQPPKAKQLPVSTSLHGATLVDPYAWLKKKGDPEVEAYLAAENAYTAEMMAPTQPLQDALFAEMKARVKETDVEPAYPMRGYLYYSRIEAGKQYGLTCRKLAPDGPEEVLIDENALAVGQKFIDVSDFEISSDNQLMAVTIDHSGFREYQLTLKNLKTGEVFPEAIEHVTSAVFANDNVTMFYTIEDSAKRSYRLYRHVLKTPVSKDTLVLEEKDERFEVAVGRSRSDRFVELSISSATTSEISLLDANKPNAPFKVVRPRKQDVMYSVEDRGSSLFMVTNEKCRTNQLIEVPLQKPTAAGKVVLPCRPDVGLDGVEVFQDFFVASERVNGLPTLRAVEFSKGRETRFDMPEEAYSLQPITNAEFKTDVFRYAYGSLVTPWTSYERNVKTGELKVLKEDPIPAYDKSKYETRRVMAKARDGVMVPVSVAMKKGTLLDGSASMFLEGYGAYGSVYDPSFDQTRVSFLDRGIILAYAHVRGGGEFGKPWHDQGRMMTKKTTFTDFIDCADWLIAHKWTSAKHLAITGASAGGLLMGAVLNERPELFRAALVEVPFVDVINSMLDESMPLTVGEFEEWGNPKEKAAFAYMRSYSPYDNVKDQLYPAMLVRSSYNDSQVLFHEPTKWVAKMRAVRTDSAPLYLKMEMDPAGHGGRSGRYDTLHDTAYLDAFVLSELGFTK